MEKVLIAIFAISIALPMSVTAGEARDSGLSVRFIAQDKIAFEKDETVVPLEASSTFSLEDIDVETEKDGE